jgi:hypothetical protein
MEALAAVAFGELAKLGPFAVIAIAGLLWDRREVKKERDAAMQRAVDLEAKCDALQEKRLSEGREMVTALQHAAASNEALIKVVERGLR